MYISKKEREELSNLSEEVFGTRSRWQKLITKGYPELVTKTIVESVPGENGAEPTSKESVVPVLTESGVKQFTAKYHTLESVKEYMLTLKKQRDDIKEMIAKQNEEKRIKAEQEKLAKSVQEEYSGSAL